MDITGINMSERARWYVVHTYSGYENKVKATIEKTIENRNLQELFVDVLCRKQIRADNLQVTLTYKLSALRLCVWLLIYTR